MADEGIVRSHAALAAGSQSFALAGKLLPRACRDDAAVVYAYCRRADDLIDEAPAPAAAARGLTQLRRELDDIVAGRPQADPVLAAFAHVMHRRAIPRVHVDELIAGFAMDVAADPDAPIVYETWADLLLYCYRVAGTVGLMMCHVMGADDPRAARPAAALGMAMQLTNIARDVAEDWPRGRRYIPGQALPAGADLRPGGQLSPATATRLSLAVPALLAAAAPLYRLGDTGLRHLDLRSAMAVRAARLIYGGIGEVIARRGHDITAGRARVSRARKIWLAVRAFTEVTADRARIDVRRPRRGLPAIPSPGGDAPGPLPAPFLELPWSSEAVR
jgi:phytoene synthase